MKQMTIAVLLLSGLSVFSQSTFTRVYNLLQTNCATASCHSASAATGGLDLSGTETKVYNAIVEVAPNNPAAAAKGDKYIDKGYPDRSFLLRKIARGLSHDLQLTANEGSNMPNNLPQLAWQDIELVRQWILWAAPQTGSPVDYQVLTDYYTDSSVARPKIARPPAPPAGQGYQIHFGPVFWKGGEEIEYFKKYDPEFTQLLEVHKFELYMNSESHHFILRKFRPGEDANWSDGLVPFTIQAFNSGKDFVNAWQISTDLDLPVGTGFFWDQNTVLDLNYHMKNYHQNEILPGEFYINVWTRPRGTSTVEMKAELIPKLDIFILGNQTASFDERITRSGQTWNIWMLSTHTHKFGTDYDIFLGNSTNSSDQIYEGFYDFDYTFNQGFYDWSHPPVKYFNPMLPVNMTSGLTHMATYHNTSSQLVTWGFTTAGEMMLIYVQYTTQSVNYKPPVNSGSSGPVCNSVTLNTDAGLEAYLWSTGDTTQSATVTQSGTYSVTVTDGSGTTYSSDPVTVTVINTSVNINNGNDAAICSGASATLDAGSGFAAYLWSNNDTSASISVTAAGTYTVTATDANGCTATDNAVVSQASSPVVSLNNEALCSGESATLDAANPGASYSWSTGAATQTIPVSIAGNYYVTVTNADGCSGTDFATVTIHPLPVVNMPDVSVCQGSSATLNAGNPGSAYAWTTGEITRSINVSQPGTYGVTVTNSFSCEASDDATLTFGSSLSVNIPDESVCQGDSVILDAGFEGSTFLWSTGATSQTITVSAADTYSVTVSDQNGCNGSDDGTVTILQKPSADAGEDKAMCEGSSVVLTATGGVTYHWATGDATSEITVTQPGSYEVTVTGANGCADKAQANVTLSLVQTGSIAGNDNVVLNETVQYSVTANAGSTYAWQVISGTLSATQGISVSVTWNVAGTGTVTVVETNADGCAGDAVEKQVVVGTTGAAAVDGGRDILIFPNPASSFITIQFSRPGSGEYRLNMIDVSGKIVKTIPSVSGSEIVISRENMTEGLYFIELKGEKAIRQKVVIAD